MGLGAGWHYVTHGLVVQNCKLQKMVVASLLNLQVDSHDLPKARGEVNSWK